MYVAAISPLPNLYSMMLVLGATIYAGVMEEWWFVAGTTFYALIKIIGSVAWVSINRKLKPYPEVGDNNELDCLQESIEMFRSGKYDNLDYIETILKSCEQNLEERPDTMRRLRLAGLRLDLKALTEGVNGDDTRYHAQPVPE
jgi:hypothetical protein